MEEFHDKSVVISTPLLAKLVDRAGARVSGCCTTSVFL